MRERKETGVHGTLLMSQDDWKLNSKQLLSKTFNSRMNIIETRAVLNMVKCALGPKLIRRLFLP